MKVVCDKILQKSAITDKITVHNILNELVYPGGKRGQKESV